ncbi:MAG: glutamine synthetase family protein [Actinobacteria bacterium]|nr:glutamine synthetase family protein [Actinomycetota bacterium]
MAAGDNKDTRIQDVLDIVAREKVKFVNLQFTDIVGMVKHVTIPAHEVEDTLLHGKWFDGSSIEGFARIHESDMYLEPDLNTFGVIPFSSSGMTTAKVTCNVCTPDGEAFLGDPRYILKQALKGAEELGFKFFTGPELEFYLFKMDGGAQPTPLPHDEGSYFDISTDLAADVRKEMVEALEMQGITVETSHHEVGPGQHEIDLRYDEALQTADKVVEFKGTLKSVAHRHELHATFMPKPVHGIAGSGMHTHQSLWSISEGRNAFYDPHDQYGLSEVAKQFIAGQLTHAKGMCAVLSPLVNSYKRLVAGFEAPVYISWARTNRSALIRIPKISASKPEATRIELRSPDPTSNPYLAFAVMLKAGLDGVKRKLPLPQPIEEDLFEFTDEMMERHGVGTLPGSLHEALDEMEKDEVMREALGPHIFARFLEAKTMEWKEFRQRVTSWEIDRYLGVY